MGSQFNTEGMLDMYIYENSRLVERIQELVLENKDSKSFDPDTVNEIFRAMHTIKGSSGMMMLDGITEVSHRLEDIFYYIRESHITSLDTEELASHVMDALDYIKSEMDKLTEGREADGRAVRLVEELDAYLNSVKSVCKGNEETDNAAEKKSDTSVSNAPARFYIAPVKSASGSFYRIDVKFKADTKMANVYAYKAIYALRVIAEDMRYIPENIISDESTAATILSEGFRIYLRATADVEKIEKTINDSSYEVESVTIEKIRADEFAGVREGLATARFSPGDYVIPNTRSGNERGHISDKPIRMERTSYISVEVNKMNALMDICGQLGTVEEELIGLIRGRVESGDDICSSVKKVRETYNAMLDVVIRMRMVPLTGLFLKMNRVIFDVTRKLHREAELVIQGEDIEVDKNIIEHISDPLMHMLRNCVDHGIEPANERIAAGKDPKGTVILSAEDRDDSLYICVADDGRGLDREAILKKALEKGLIESEAAGREYSDEEAYMLVTLPGFSTNEEVTEYSGRGVGMDVVVHNLAEIGGSLRIESELGKGTTMWMVIPLSGDNDKRRSIDEQ
ncbi:MAG: Hpt domain-containing protein [Lachnospiraceae bacterium]|nr:Hpt domain-containing protein [Lachnospiraceae bacterium]